MIAVILRTSQRSFPRTRELADCPYMSLLLGTPYSYKVHCNLDKSWIMCEDRTSEQYIKAWTLHGESFPTNEPESDNASATQSPDVHERLNEMLNDGFGIDAGDEIPNKQAASFDKHLEDNDAPLYPNCRRHTKLTVVVRILKRLFMLKEITALVRWHHDERVKDEVLWHPADSQAWSHFDNTRPDFSKEICNVQLGLATNGFNPFRAQSTIYSIWPVILSVYINPLPYVASRGLLASMVMHEQSYLLSLIIPGLDIAGNDIDVFLRVMTLMFFYNVGR